MKKHAKKALRSVLAFAMAVVLLATSLPIAFAAGTYDPTPVFSEDATLWAWVTDNGDVQVIYPQATPNTEYISDKHIATYYITLYDLGPLTEVHNDPATETVPQAQIVVPESDPAFASDGTGTVTFTELAKKGVTLDDTHRFSVEVLAQDSTGWVSEPLTTVVSDVPQFVYDEELYKPLSENSTSVREMMLFEAKNNDNNNQFSNDGLSGAKDYIQSGDTLKILGPIDQAGEENVSTGVDSKAYGFQISAAPSNGTTQSFSTAWSRQHWMGTDAEEVWYWLDLSQVDLTGLSFDLKANGKRYGEFYWKNERMFGGYDTGRTFNSTPADDAYSLVTYSTRGTAADTYKGEAPYVYIQQDNGAWEKVMLTNGTIDLGHYKGYVRVPIEFMCSTKATYAEAHNDNFNMGSTAYDIDRAEENVKNFFDTQVLFENGPVLVDEVGTPISDALLIQYRVFQIDVETGWNLSGGNESKYSLPYENDYPSVGANHYAHLEQPTWGASMLAAGYDQTDVDANLTVNSDSDPDNDKAYVDANGVVQNRENGYKAIDDIFGAGFSYTGVSSDSVNKSFFIDNVLFYKETGSYPSDMTEGETGAPVTNYYDQKVETPRIILSQIDQLITTPDLGDFRAVQYIDELIDGYRKAYSDAGMSTDFLSEENMATVAASLGMSGVWQRYLDARKACVDGGTIAYDKDSGTYTYLPNNEATDLVPKLIQSLEKLPDPSQVTSVSDTLRDEIVRLFQLYRRLNLTQLDAMSESEEQRILDYVALVRAAGGDEMLVGTSLATNKFLSFNDFESLPEGTHAYDLQDSPSWDQGKDYRYSKGFVYGSMSFRDFAAHSTAAVGDWMGDVSQDSYSNGLYDALNLAAADAVITDEVGAGGTKGAQVTIDSRFFSGDEGDPTGYVNAVSVTRDFNSTTGDYHDLQSIADWQLSRYAESWSASDGRDYPVGLVFYVDFSELKDIDFLLSLNIATSYDGHAEGYNLDMDMSGSEQAYKIMDMETGEWVTITGTGSPYGFTSKGGSSSIGTLADGYKGYVYVALNKFEYSTGMGTVDLCAMGEQIDNIRRVEVGVMPLNSTAAAQMDGRSFVVDDIGFAYGADTYDAALSGSLNHPSFEEVKGYKSTAAQNFENAVSAIELNDDTNFPSRVQAASELYDALSDYQKNNTTSVKQAYAQLEFYEKIVNGELSADDYKPQMTVAEFSNMVGSLSNELKNASVTGDHDLPYPGVKDTDGDGRADAVNYEGYNGLTKELAAQIIEYYNTSYSRYTENEKTALGITAQQFLNAYNAASRCYNTLEGLLADSNTFLNELYNPADASTSLFRTLSEIYPAKADQDGLGTVGDMTQPYPYDKSTPYGTRVTAEGTQADEGHFISISDTKALDHISKTYRSQMNYYAKHLLVAGQLQEGVKNIPNAVRKLVYNSYSTDRHGDPFTGGIWTLYNRYLTLYNNAKAKINAGTALTDEELADLKLATDEYEMLLPTYHDVAELYDLIQQIYDLFPAVTSTLTATGSSPSTNQTILLSYDGEAAAVENKIDPVYTLTQFEQYLTDLDGTGTLTMTSQNGGLLKSADGTESLAYEFTYGGRTADFSGGAIEIGSYSAPMSAGIAMHVKISDPQAFPMELSDVVTLTYTYQYTDRFGILREATDVKTVTIRYATDDMYVVEVPAEVEIPWGSDSVKASYVVTCNLNEGSTIDVGITPAAARFDLSANGTAETISCTADSPAAATYSGTQIEATATNPMTISIDASEWQNIPVAAYRADDQITYTVTYTDGSATP